MVISHDRYLIERLCDSTWALFGDGELTNLPGGIEQYLELRAEQAKALGTDENSMNLGGQGGDVEKTEKKESTGLSAQEDRELRKQMNAAERKMAKLGEKIAGLEEEMAAAAEAMDHEKLAELNEALQAANGEHEDLEMEWLEAAERRENA